MSTDGDPDSLIPGELSRVQFAKLCRLIDHLDYDAQEIMNLYYNEEFNPAEIAEILGVPEEQVRTRLTETVNHLRSEMK